ncbi:unnamed protein product [Tuber melanosporum]|uniref:(Perigord truffle) hypothetical protein n=1 Tax=Tuber melanosporum (strain Mel28) TaxID=656061 RepID=D5GN11_TUBMM|nr:uncharacterized protein GSTUM_00011009001 [Tuber melanosporum]KAG0138433.1 hypothetical protein HOY82DRAFT_476216 [Tuber indicum]CAZ85886.1 unnamed protein product [Tuber melanosporum]
MVSLRLWLSVMVSGQRDLHQAYRRVEKHCNRMGGGLVMWEGKEQAEVRGSNNEVTTASEKHKRGSEGAQEGNNKKSRA